MYTHPAAFLPSLSPTNLREASWRLQQAAGREANAVMLGRARIIMLLLVVAFVCGVAAAGALSVGDVESLAGSGTEEFPGEFDTSATSAHVLCGGLLFWQSFDAASGGGGAAAAAGPAATMVTIIMALSLVIAFCRCWRNRTGSAAAERCKQRRVPKEKRKVAIVALLVLFLAGAADRRSTLVAEATPTPAPTPSPTSWTYGK